jgi:pre-mRNA-processing factor 6
MSRRDFLNQQAPENYVAGLGRGATGFTTRSDLGPVRDGPNPEQMQEILRKRAEQLGAAPPTAYGAPAKKTEEEEDDDRFADPDNETGLFASGTFTQDDDEADRIYQAVDEKMLSRRKRRREEREEEEFEEHNRKNPKIADQFADLKRGLAALTDDEWASIPDVGDLTGKNRRAKQQRMSQRSYAVPDSVLAHARDAGEFSTTVQDGGADGAATSADNKDGTMTNFAEIGAARDRVLQTRLDRVAKQDAGTGSATTIDPKGYLTSLDTAEFDPSTVQLGEIQRVRELLKSVINTNQRHAPAWIAAARLERHAGKIVAARKLMAQGCKMCPKSEDAWLENIRLNEGKNAKIIAKDAIENNEQSTKLWIEAMRLETDVKAKKRVMQLALDHVPQSVAFWKEAVNLEEDPEDAKLLLAKATELIPLSVDLWLALAHLETPENAQKVLNKARRAVPTSYEIWIAAARLQEQMGNADKVNIIKNAVKALLKEGGMLKREEWIEQAEKCEAEGARLTCASIIRETLGWSLDEDDDRLEIFKDDAKASIGREKYDTARAIYAYALRVFPTSKSLWLASADLEKNHGTKEELWKILDKAVEACPQSEVLWLQLAREKWQAGEVDGSRDVLYRAFKQNPNNEEIWLAAVKLEKDAKEVDRARDLLAVARREASTERVWYQSAAYERQLGNTDIALDLVLQGLQSTIVDKKETRFPRSAKLWMMKGQIYEDKGMVPQAREAYSQGTRQCPKSVPLWLLAARLEQKQGITIKARSVLDRARLQNPKNAELWAESVRVELQGKKPNVQQAKNLMSKALQECPKSGLLWSENIWKLQPRTQRKPLSLEAMKAVDNDPVLLVTIARIFWSERQLEKAVNWFEKAILLDTDLGDTWAWYLKFLMQHGEVEKQEDVINKCIANEPKHGEVWQRVRKDPKNAYLSTKEVLMEATRQLEQTEVIT